MSITAEPFIMPNDKIRIGRENARVIASCIYNDDEGKLMTQTVLLLRKETPHFQVALVNELHVVLSTSDRFLNIVPAVAEYEQWGGDY